jgi:hypothetical protein
VIPDYPTCHPKTAFSLPELWSNFIISFSHFKPWHDFMPLLGRDRAALQQQQVSRPGKQPQLPCMG